MQYFLEKIRNTPQTLSRKFSTWLNVHIDVSLKPIVIHCPMFDKWERLSNLRAKEVIDPSVKIRICLGQFGKFVDLSSEILQFHLVFWIKKYSFHLNLKSEIEPDSFSRLFRITLLVLHGKYMEKRCFNKPTCEYAEPFYRSWVLRNRTSIHCSPHRGNVRDSDNRIETHA